MHARVLTQHMQTISAINYLHLHLSTCLLTLINQREERRTCTSCHSLFINGIAHYYNVLVQCRTQCKNNFNSASSAIKKPKIMPSTKSNVASPEKMEEDSDSEINNPVKIFKSKDDDNMLADKEGDSSGQVSPPLALPAVKPLTEEQKALLRQKLAYGGDMNVLFSNFGDTPTTNGNEYLLKGKHVLYLTKKFSYHALGLLNLSGNWQGSMPNIFDQVQKSNKQDQTRKLEEYTKLAELKMRSWNASKSVAIGSPGGSSEPLHKTNPGEKTPLIKITFSSDTPGERLSEADLRELVLELDDLQDKAILEGQEVKLMGRATFENDIGEVSILSGDELSAAWLEGLVSDITINGIKIKAQREVKVITKKIKFFIPKAWKSEIKNLVQKLAAKNGLSEVSIRKHWKLLSEAEVSDGRIIAIFSIDQSSYDRFFKHLNGYLNFGLLIGRIKVLPDEKRRTQKTFKDWASTSKE